MTEFLWRVPLHGPELLYAPYMDKHKGANNMVAVLHMSLAKPCSTSSFFNTLASAVQLVHSRHPLLQTVIPQPVEKDDFYFVKYENETHPKIQVAVLENNETAWHKKQFEQLNAAFGYDELLYRVHLFQYADDNAKDYLLVLTFHHVLVDAGSLNNYLNDLFTLLDAKLQLTTNSCEDVQTMIKEVAAVKPTPVPSSAITLFPEAQQLFSLDYIKTKWLTAMQTLSLGAKPVLEFPTNLGHEECHVLQFEYEAETTNELITVCQKHGVSLRDYLNATAAIALCNEFASKQELKTFERKVPMNCLRDLRRAKNVKHLIPDDSIRTCTGSLTIAPIVSNDCNVWKVAKACREEKELMLSIHEDLFTANLLNQAAMHNTESTDAAYPLIFDSMETIQMQGKVVNMSIVSVAMSTSHIRTALAISSWISNGKLMLSVSYKGILEESYVQNFAHVWDATILDHVHKEKKLKPTNFYFSMENLQ